MSVITQEEQVIKMLRRAGMHGVPNYDFPRHRVLSYTKVISDLRKDGYNIITERLRLPNGKYLNTRVYTLIEEKKKKWWQR